MYLWKSTCYTLLERVLDFFDFDGLLCSWSLLTASGGVDNLPLFFLGEESGLKVSGGVENLPFFLLGEDSGLRVRDLLTTASGTTVMTRFGSGVRERG